MIDLGIILISSYALKNFLPDVTGTASYITIWMLSFIITALQLIFKLVDTRYDMIIALLFPIFKLIPFFLAMRDCLSSQYEYRKFITSNQENDPGRLISFFRLFETFK